PRTTIRLRPERLAHFGFRPTEVMEAVQTAYQGTVVAQTHRANQTSDVVVILDEASRRDPESVGTLMVSNGEGQRVPLQVLADVSPSSGRYEIPHEGSQRALLSLRDRARGRRATPRRGPAKLAEPGPRAGKPALRARGWCVGGGGGGLARPNSGSDLDRDPGGLRDALRDHHSKLAHDDLPLRPSRDPRGTRLGRRDGAARSHGARDPDPHDGERHGSGSRPARLRQWPGGPRDRGSDGDRDSRRACDLDGAESPGAANACAALRTLRPASRRDRGQRGGLTPGRRFERTALRGGPSGARGFRRG